MSKFKDMTDEELKAYVKSGWDELTKDSERERLIEEAETVDWLKNKGCINTILSSEPIITLFVIGWIFGSIVLAVVLSR